MCVRVSPKDRESLCVCDLRVFTSRVKYSTLHRFSSFPDFGTLTNLCKDVSKPLFESEMGSVDWKRINGCLSEAESCVSAERGPRAGLTLFSTSSQCERRACPLS